MKPYISKSKYVAGLQCPKLLWWQIHEPDADELEPDFALQAVFDQGNEVGARAREHVPGGVLIEADSLEGKLEATRRALDRGERVIYEAAIEHDGGLFIADILERNGPGWNLIEVKSSTKVKPLHRPDLALQTHVARGAGLDVRRAELMHLNRQCRYPDLSNLFVRADLTHNVEKLLTAVGPQLESFHRMLQGPLPEVEPGGHCSRPYACPFVERCHDYSEFEIKSKPVGLRRLASELERLEHPIAHLDFETISPAIPVWGGCRPYDQIPVQISVHVEHADGRAEHHEWLADGPDDPRPEMAKRVVEYTRGARTVLAYHVSFEAGRIRELQEAVPQLEDELEGVIDRLVDLLPIVRENVRHPAFHAGHGLKIAAPVLVPDVGYDDLDIADGMTASVTLKRLLLGDDMTDEERSSTRRALLDYCRLDTLAMVRMLERLRELAGITSQAKT